MSTNFQGDNLVLAIDPSYAGVGCVVMKGSRFLVDYGLKTVRREHKNADSLAKVVVLLSTYHPTVLIIEDCADRSSYRRTRIRRLLKQIEELADTKRTRVEKFSPAQVREAFAGRHASNKYQIAVDVAKRLPELSHRLPPPRKVWMAEQQGMSIFNSAALAFTHFHYLEKRERKAA